MVPAHLSLITTDRSWNDLVLDNETLQQVKEIKNWFTHSSPGKPRGRLKSKLKSGYHVLFYGPPASGKTLTAALLGKEFDKPVYRIDLSMVVSKYIGETEKNLAKIFEEAKNKQWILFFDEADALFGKRTEVKDAHDRFANQEISYLLQRMEDYEGLVILATNLKTNIDDAFTRRFQSIVHFPIPNNRRTKR